MGYSQKLNWKILRRGMTVLETISLIIKDDGQFVLMDEHERCLGFMGR
jgi:hypothetical protein